MCCYAVSVATAPLEFTTIEKGEVATFVQGFPIIFYDWLIRAVSQEQCLARFLCLVQRVQQLGLLIN